MQNDSKKGQAFYSNSRKAHGNYSNHKQKRIDLKYCFNESRKLIRDIVMMVYIHRNINGNDKVSLNGLPGYAIAHMAKMA